LRVDLTSDGPGSGQDWDNSPRLPFPAIAVVRTAEPAQQSINPVVWRFSWNQISEQLSSVADP